MNKLGLELNDNQRRFLGQVIRRPNVRRHELAAELGFSPQTAMRVVQPLIEAGIIIESDEPTGVRGKRPKITEFVRSSLLTVGIVLAPDRITVSFSDLNGQIISRETVRQEFTRSRQQLGVIEELLADLSMDLPQNARVVSSGVAASGFFLERGRRIVSRVDPGGWAEIDLKQKIEQLTGVPTAIENDGHIIATSILEEDRRQNFIAIFLDARIGGGIVADGRLVHGHHGNAGVVGRLFKEGSERPSEPGLRRALQLDDWDSWKGVSSLSSNRETELNRWLDDIGKQFTDALNQALSLFDFEAAYICSRIPQDILEMLASRIQFIPLGANLDFGLERSFVMPKPIVVGRRVENFAGMAHTLAARLFLNPPLGSTAIAVDRGR
ncbi:ROK family protein [Rhizobium sp. TRM95796]|uniref:ROK family protein n=1 Tax=Rhizobium sp. TRM95796 TaxID=2979862 RepID=UPI0021E781DE|nr:ROK family transcriptional regulator [Rhizobium sp. TRM95796]MCV3768140.1 ROK family protein [Rhizobium sp. TRM95796]